jgi:hypothetical protein
MLDGLHKYAGQKVRQRGSSPKFVTLNNAFISAQSELSLEQAKEDPAYRGRLVESAVGAHLVNEARSGGYEVLLASFALGRFFVGVVYEGRLTEKVILSTTSWSSAGSRCA